MNKYFIKTAIFNIFLAVCGCWPIYYVPRDHRKQNERILFFFIFQGVTEPLKELIFAGAKFREFRGFWGHPRNLIPAKRKNLTIREI